MAQQVSEDDGSVSPAAPAAGLKVLVVEDEALIRMDLAEMLTAEGYVVAGEAGDGEQARDAGAMAYLVKPFARHELVPAIELAVSRFAEKRALEDEVATLSERLETRKVVDRAKGLLMTRQQMTEPEAFRWIQRTAMDRRTTMKAVAEAVVEGLATPRA